MRPRSPRRSEAKLTALRGELFAWVASTNTSKDTHFFSSFEARTRAAGFDLAELLGCDRASVPKLINFLLHVDHDSSYGHDRDHANLVLDRLRELRIDVYPLLADGAVLSALQESGVTLIGARGLFERVVRTYLEAGELEALLTRGAMPLVEDVSRRPNLSALQAIARMVRECGRQEQFCEILSRDPARLESTLTVAATEPYVFLDLARALTTSDRGVPSRAFPGCLARAALRLNPELSAATAVHRFDQLAAAAGGALPKPERLPFAEVVAKAITFLQAADLPLPTTTTTPPELVALVSKPEDSGYASLAKALERFPPRRCAELGTVLLEAAKLVALPAVALAGSSVWARDAVAGVASAFLVPRDGQPSLRLADALHVAERYERLQRGFRVRELPRPDEIPALFTNAQGEPTYRLEVPGEQGLSIVELRNDDEVFAEMREMHHCGGEQWWGENEENLHKFSIRDDQGRSLATLDLRFVAQSPSDAPSPSAGLFIPAQGPRGGAIRKDPGPVGPGDTSRLEPAAQRAIDWLYGAIERGDIRCTGEGKIVRRRAPSLAENVGFDVTAPDGEGRWQRAFEQLRSVTYKNRRRWIAESIATPRDFLARHRIAVSIAPSGSTG